MKLFLETRHAGDVFVSETAVNIGYSCRLLTDDMADIHVIDADTRQDVENQLTDARRKMTSHASSHMQQRQQPTANGYGGQPNGAADCGTYAIIINGHSLVSNNTLIYLSIRSIRETTLLRLSAFGRIGRNRHIFNLIVFYLIH